MLSQRLGTVSRTGMRWCSTGSLRPRIGAPSSLHVSCSASGTGQGSVVPHPDVQDLAKRAQIGVSDKEATEWSPKINSILDWFGQLQAVDVAGVQPAIHTYSEGNRLRPDEAHSYVARAQLLAQAPEVEKTYVRVPKTAGGDSSSPSTSGAKPANGVNAPKAAPAQDSPSSVNWEAIHALDIRVGKIVSCERHPDADSLYVEKIDVGEAEPRTIVSGLVKYVPLEQMQDRLVVVICNLKPRNMRGIKSFGMLLAASNAEHTAVEPLVPPQGAKAGERVWFGGSQEQPAAVEPKVMDKKKFWEAVQPLLQTDDACVASCSGLAMNTSSGPLKSATLTGARIA